MTKRTTVSLLITALMLIGFVRAAFAQTETPPQVQPESWVGQVSGTITNQTPGGAVPAKLDLMLHAWDRDNIEKLMMHGTSTPAGAFVFEDVSFEPGLVYAVMADYEDAMYTSDFVPVETGQKSLQVDVPIYEANNDLSQARVDQLHVLFFFEQGGLAVSEVYVLSNLGQTTIKAADTLDDGTPVTLKFSLPDDAASIDFNSENSGRFLQFSGGFADTSPLLPGQGSGQVMVSYILPYEGSRTFSYTAPASVGGISILIPQDSGISLTGAGFEPSGEWSMQEGANFSVFSHAGLETGQTVQVTLSGEPKTGMGSSESLASRDSSRGIAIGSVVLGLALIFLGVWWWRKPAPKPQVVPARDFEQILTEIALLDQAHERGEIDQDEYTSRRADLRAQAKATSRDSDPV